MLATQPTGFSKTVILKPRPTSSRAIILRYINSKQSYWISMVDEVDQCFIH